MSYLIDNQRVTGRINRPRPGEPPTQVKATARAQRGEDIATKEFNITLRPWTHLEIVEYEAQILTHAALYLPLNTNEGNIVADLVLKETGFLDCTIKWSSSANTLINADPENGPMGKVNRPTFAIGDQTCVVTAVITSGTGDQMQTKVIEYRFTVRAASQTSKEAADAYLANDSKFVPSTWTTGSDAGQNPTTPGFIGISNDLILPNVDGLFSIRWESSDETTLRIVPGGAQPILKAVSGTAVLTAKVQHGTYTTEPGRTFNIRIAQDLGGGS
jgi:hypothetical protein